MTNISTPQATPRGAWLTESETAERLNMSVKWLRKRRLTGEAPPYAKFGAAVRYAVCDIERFEAMSMRQSTSQ